MKNLIFIFSLLSATSTFAQAPLIEWQKCYGGNSSELAQNIIQTFDGGFIMIGSTWSSDSFDLNNHGAGDLMIIKTDNQGSIQWKKGMGGSGSDAGNYIAQTKDSGYIIAGTSIFSDGDLNGLNNHGNGDIWIVKLSSSGTLQWQKLIGGSALEDASYIQQTKDGGYFVAGYSGSSDGDVTANHGINDYWAVKLNAAGNIQWQKSFGGSEDDALFSATQTFDNGYILAGYSASKNGNISGHHGDSTVADYWIVKLDSVGSMQWERSYGGTGVDIAYSIQQTKDSNYIIAGRSASADGDLTVNFGNADYWIVKIDANGSILWQRSFGSGGDDYANSVQQTSDNGYVIAGFAAVSGSHGGVDYWVIKLDSKGILQWDSSYGSASDDFACCIRETSDRGYIVAGYSSSNSYDVTNNHGGADFWIVKLKGQPTGVIENIAVQTVQIYPNPTTDVLDFRTESSLSGKDYFITDLIGSVVCKGTIDKPSTEISLKDIPAGIYLLHLDVGVYKVEVV